MPRQQPPPDPTAGPTAAFALDLYALRQAANSPAYREMGEQANISHTSLSRAAKGQRFPTWETTRAFVIACGADVDLWQERWETARRQVEEEKIQKAPTVRFSPVRTAIPTQDPPTQNDDPTWSNANTGGIRHTAPTPLPGALPALTARFTAELEGTATSPPPDDPDSEPSPAPGRRSEPTSSTPQETPPWHWAALILLITVLALTLTSIISVVLSKIG